MEPLRHDMLAGGWPIAITGALRPGMRLGRYELLVPVAFGGMACVWAARLSGFRGFSKLVAIKTVLPHLASHGDFENMLLDEARIAADAHHANVCNLFDVGEQDGVIYLVLEWINGDSLLHVLGGSRTTSPSAFALPLEYHVAARIVADACAGLHAAHELTDERGRPLGVVHRDVSPHNVLVSLEGTTKIADFGIAQAAGQLHQATLVGEIRGKLAYMAPEQVSGATIDRRADIFAMGCVFYHATTGQPPFRGGCDARLIQAVMDGSYEPPVQVAADYPPDLAAITTRALSQRPEDRFETADGMRNALEAWLASCGRVATTNEVGDVVRDRIGAKLEQRRQAVRAALDAGQAPGSTRPVLSPALSPPNGVPCSSVPSGPPALQPHPSGAAARLLVPGGMTSPDAGRPAHLSRARGPLKLTAAVTLGLLAALAVLLLRARLGDAGLVRPAALSLATAKAPPAFLPPATVVVAAPAAAVSSTVTHGPSSGPPPLAAVHTALPRFQATDHAQTSEPTAGRPATHASDAAGSGRTVEIPANPY